MVLAMGKPAGGQAGGGGGVSVAVPSGVIGVSEPPSASVVSGSSPDALEPEHADSSATTQQANTTAIRRFMHRSIAEQHSKWGGFSPAW